MALEEFSIMISLLRKKLIYIITVFGAGAIFSFPFMGDIIKKIEYDMFYRLNLPVGIDASKQLIDISHNLSSMSNELIANNSSMAMNLTKISGDLLNISQNLNMHKLVYLTPLEVQMLKFKMSLIVGALLASPLIIYYGYKGVKGRLTNILPVNKSFLVSAVFASIILFLLGAAYSYFSMLPIFLTYIYQDAMSLGVNPTLSIYEFIYFIVMTTVILGFAFELPLIMTLLVRLGVTSPRTLAYYRKHAYIILLIIAAWVTPDSTGLSQIMVMLPFVVLYEVTLLVMRMTGTKDLKTS